ncbi:FecR domain-containing protein [Marinibaculum pumilum]|uniref:FecR domain-containing protein n=1 Tax=Marinibaculum pumilum TaxID=1766165 RepID=A0ABV7KUW4_9PROT
MAVGLGTWLAMPVLSGGSGPAGAALAAADRIAVASKVSGTVHRESAGQRIDLNVGDPIHSADHVLTGQDGRVRLQFPDGSTVVVGPGSDLEVASYDMKSETKPGGLLRLAEGILRAIVDTMPANGQFAVAAPTAVAAVRGTAFVVEASADNTGVFVIDGIVSVSAASGAGGPVTVQNNRGTDVPKGGTPTPPAAWGTDRIKKVFALTKLD